MAAKKRKYAKAISSRRSAKSGRPSARRANTGTTAGSRNASNRGAVRLGVDWAGEIQSLVTDLAPDLCDSPEKCRMLVVRVTLRDRSHYLVSGHSRRLARLPDGTTAVLAVQFVGQDQNGMGVALSVRPDDILKVELVDIPDEGTRPPFGFARHMADRYADPAANAPPIDAATSATRSHSPTSAPPQAAYKGDLL